jgi:hypothetical protein
VDEAPENEKWLYVATLPICRYYVMLRYTLLQLLYDQMFDNLLTGLPIARSLVSGIIYFSPRIWNLSRRFDPKIITNEQDSSLVGEVSFWIGL